MNKKEDYQEIYINLDDSGKLTRKKSIGICRLGTFIKRRKR